MFAASFIRLIIAVNVSYLSNHDCQNEIMAAINASNFKLLHNSELSLLQQMEVLPCPCVRSTLLAAMIELLFANSGCSIIATSHITYIHCM